MIKEIEFELCILYLSLNKANKTLTTKIYAKVHFIQETNDKVCIFRFHKLFKACRPVKGNNHFKLCATYFVTV